MQDSLSPIILETEADTDALAVHFANCLVPGDTVLLFGDLGAGKSSFARSFIRSRFGAELEVPSPTFTLVQTYEHPKGDIWHCDLYRLEGPAEIIELGLDDAFDDSICLVEWPERLEGSYPASAISLRLEVEGEGRKATLSGSNPRILQIMSHYD